MLVKLLGRTDLLNDAVVHHGDAVADRVGFFLVMGDEDRGQSEPLLQFAQLAADLDPQLGIEIGKGLVEQQQFRLDRDGARERDALLLSAGKLRRAALAEPGQSDEFKGGGDTRADLGAGDPLFLEPERDIARHRHVRPQRVGLEHHADVPLPGRQAGDVGAANQDPAAVGAVESRDQPEQRGLAAAGRPEKGEEFAGTDVEIDRFQHVVGAVRQVHLFDADIGGRNGKLAAGWGCRHDDQLLACAVARLRSMTKCDNRVQAATSATAMTPSAAPGPRPAADCINT